MRGVLFKAVLVIAATLSGAAVAADAKAPAMPTIQIIIRNHRFVPNQVTAPAGVKFKIQVRNEDATPEEFESYDFKVEKIVTPKGTITVTVGPLKPGTYAFFGEFNPKTAKGTLTVPAAGAR